VLLEAVLTPDAGGLPLMRKMGAGLPVE